MKTNTNKNIYKTDISYTMSTIMYSCGYINAYFHSLNDFNDNCI